MNAVAKVVAWVKDNMPALVASEERAAQLVRECKSSATGYMAETETGIVLAFDRPTLWAEKRNTQIVVLSAPTVADAEGLIAGLMEWQDRRRGSLLVCYTAPFYSIAEDALLNAGFTQQGTMLVKLRYDENTYKEAS